MPTQSRRASGGSLRSHQATAAKKGSDSAMRRNSSVVALTGAAAVAKLDQHRPEGEGHGAGECAQHTSPAIRRGSQRRSTLFATGRGEAMT